MSAGHDRGHVGRRRRQLAGPQKKVGDSGLQNRRSDPKPQLPDRLCREQASLAGVPLLHAAAEFPPRGDGSACASKARTDADLES